MNKELLKKYFNNECTPAEQLLVEQYLAGEDLAVFESYMDEEASAESSEQPDFKSDELYANIQKQIKSTERSSFKRYFSIYNLSIAATLLIICGFGIWFTTGLPGKKKNLASQFIWIKNKTNTVNKLTMPDSTLIWLSPNSAIAYSPSGYLKSKREILLKGEAFFDVKHLDNNLFSVKAGQLKVNVLGTAYHVESYEIEDQTRVTLIRGKVQLKSSAGLQTLKPGQKAIFNKHLKTIEVQKTDQNNISYWTNGEIIFEDLPLATVFSRLENLYHIKIRVSNSVSLNKKKLTGNFRREDVDSVLNKLLFVHGLHFNKTEKQYIIIN